MHSKEYSPTRIEIKNIKYRIKQHQSDEKRCIPLLNSLFIYNIRHKYTI